MTYRAAEPREEESPPSLDPEPNLPALQACRGSGDLSIANGHLGSNDSAIRVAIANTVSGLTSPFTPTARVLHPDSPALKK